MTDQSKAANETVVKTRLLAAVQLVTAPILLLWFVFAKPSLIPEWTLYVGRCSLSIFDGRRR